MPWRDIQYSGSISRIVTCRYRIRQILIVQNRFFPAFSLLRLRYRSQAKSLLACTAGPIAGAFLSPAVEIPATDAISHKARMARSIGIFMRVSFRERQKVLILPH